MPLDVVTSFVLYEIVEARDCPVLCCGSENALDMLNCLFCARFCFVIHVRKMIVWNLYICQEKRRELSRGSLSMGDVL